LCGDPLHLYWLEPITIKDFRVIEQALTS